MMRSDRKGDRCRLWLVVTCAAMIVAGCASHVEHGRVERSKPVPPPEFPQDSEEGYLPVAALPDSLALLPPPPEPGSGAFAIDEAYGRKSLTLRDTPAWALAKLDADLTFPHAAGAFSCALNAPVTQQDTPHLYTLLQRALADAGSSTGKAKDHYRRPRPFLVNEAPLCTPEERERLEKSGSYPSGHNAAGMAWALILTEISPRETEAILARGQAFGVSRIVCNVHWRSDTLQGQEMGTYTVARLHAEPRFRADVDAARAELAAVRARGLQPTRDCKAEAAGIEAQRALDR
jgi:acid phosphatase (class A)